MTSVVSVFGVAYWYHFSVSRFVIFQLHPHYDTCGVVFGCRVLVLFFGVFFRCPFLKSCFTVFQLHIQHETCGNVLRCCIWRFLSCTFTVTRVLSFLVSLLSVTFRCCFSLSSFMIFQFHLHYETFCVAFQCRVSRFFSCTSTMIPMVAFLGVTFRYRLSVLFFGDAFYDF